MKILWLSNLPTSLPSKSYDPSSCRPPMSWISALQVYNCHYLDFEFFTEKEFDVTVIASICHNIDIFNLNFNKIKSITKKILFQQEGHHRAFSQENSLERNYMFNYIISISDGVLIHNECDKLYYESLYKKPCFIHNQLVSDLYDYIYLNNSIKKQGIFLGGVDERYGSLDGYLLGYETNEPMFVTGNYTCDIPQLKILPPNYDYYNFNLKLANFKLALNLSPFALGGSLPLQCAMIKTPCVGWNNSNPLRTCFPDLVAEYGDFDNLRKIINKLLSDNEFYNYVIDKARNIYLQQFNVNEYKNSMKTIFNLIQ